MRFNALLSTFSWSTPSMAVSNHVIHAADNFLCCMRNSAARSLLPSSRCCLAHARHVFHAAYIFLCFIFSANFRAVSVDAFILAAVLCHVSNPADSLRFRKRFRAPCKPCCSFFIFCARSLHDLQHMLILRSLMLPSAFFITLALCALSWAICSHVPHAIVRWRRIIRVAAMCSFRFTTPCSCAYMHQRNQAA